MGADHDVIVGLSGKPVPALSGFVAVFALHNKAGTRPALFVKHYKVG